MSGPGSDSQWWWEIEAYSVVGSEMVAVAAVSALESQSAAETLGRALIGTDLVSAREHLMFSAWRDFLGGDGPLSAARIDSVTVQRYNQVGTDWSSAKLIIR